MSDLYADATLAAGGVARAAQATGVEPKVRVVTFETAASFAAGEIKRLFRVAAHEIPVSCEIVNDAIAGATDVEIGLWRPNFGAVVAQDCLLGTLDIAAGFNWGSEKNGLAALGVEERGIKSFAQIAGDAIGAIPEDSYDVGMIFNSDVSAAGTITVKLTTIAQQ